MDAARRPIKSRSNQFIQRLSAWLAGRGFTPNSISIASMGFAASGSAALAWMPLQAGALICALGVQLRLLCNVVDGIVAVEHGKKSPVGAIYNELPDRVADTLFFLSLGYAVDSLALGWCAALLAMATAYIRVLGGALGLAQDFRGPMAKQHRMALLTVCCVLVVFEFGAWQTHYSLSVALWGITLGSFVTCATRLRAMAGLLQTNADAENRGDA
ncbi:MAG TPA: CDP-alcohol phosphatidyltransferase family protein [Pseudomonadales bacterium]|nr:CDP-alcohol phosphatidyltransferase family protein [Pseudomonadales bacterium]